MMPVPRRLTYPLCLLTGALLIIVAAVLHPDLSGDGAAQLGTIARCDAWRAIHWAFLFGFVLCLTGLVGVVGRHVGTPGEGGARAGLIVAVLAYSAWMVIVAFMVGSAWTLARSYVAAEAGMTATRVVFLYDMVHPFALAAQRLAGFALGVSTYLFGWGIVRGRVLSQWLGWFGVAGGLVAVALAVAFGEATKADEAAFVLPVLWQLVTAVVLLL
jgi:hypothetical protein